MKKRKEKHGTPQRQGTITLNVIDERLAESEKMLRAQLEARKFYKTATGQDLPLEAFKVEKDKDGDYVVTIAKEGNK